MSLTRCPFCEHGNPAGSKFCSECGGALHLVPCPRCGAVSQITATVCYQCRTQLPGRSADTLVLSPPADDASGPLSRRRSRVIVGTAVLAAIAVFGYYVYRPLSPVDAPQAPGAGSKASGPGAPASSGVIRRDAAAGDTKPDNANNSAGLASPATSASGNQPAAPERDPANQTRAGPQLVESQEAKATAAAITPPKAITAGKAGERGPFRPEACTEAVAALGLCITKPVQTKTTESAAAVEAAVKRPQKSETGEAGGQEPPRPQPCTEAVAALGLCTLESTQRRR